MSNQDNKASKGFTIIELLVATLVFSIVLVIILAAAVQISRLYYKGVSLANTQNDTRIITQDLENDIQYSAKTISPQTVKVDLHDGSPTGSFCIGQHVYEYKLFYPLAGSGSSSDYALRRSDGADCAPTSTNREELLGAGMQLNSLSINCQQYQRCVINVHVIFYGGVSSNQDIFYSPSGATPAYEAPDAECTGSLTDTQICAAVDYSRTVLQTI